MLSGGPDCDHAAPVAAIEEDGEAVAALVACRGRPPGRPGTGCAPNLIGCGPFAGGEVGDDHSVRAVVADDEGGHPVPIGHERRGRRCSHAGEASCTRPVVFTGLGVRGLEELTARTQRALRWRCRGRRCRRDRRCRRRRPRRPVLARHRDGDIEVPGSAVVGDDVHRERGIVVRWSAAGDGEVPVAVVGSGFALSEVRVGRGGVPSDAHVGIAGREGGRHAGQCGALVGDAA